MKEKLQALRKQRLDCYMRASIVVKSPNILKVMNALQARM